MTVLSSDAEISASGVLVESAVVSVVELRLIRTVTPPDNPPRIYAQGVKHNTYIINKTFNKPLYLKVNGVHKQIEEG